MTTEDEVDEAARDTSMRLDIIALRVDWPYLSIQSKDYRTRKIHESYARFRSPQEVAAVIDGRRAL